MSLKQTFDSDLKSALLAKDSLKVTVLRSIKSAVLYAEVELKKRDTGLSDDEILPVLKKESKKRQDSADAFMLGGRPDSSKQELAEKAIIDSYLPAPISEKDMNNAIDEEIALLPKDQRSIQQMGKIIAGVRAKLGPTADASFIAKSVREKLTEKE